METWYLCTLRDLSNLCFAVFSLQPFLIFSVLAMPYLLHGTFEKCPGPYALKSAFFSKQTFLPEKKQTYSTFLVEADN